MTRGNLNLTAVDLFCGVGGLSQGFGEAGFKILFANDYEEYSSKTYKHNHPETAFIRGDIHKITSREILDIVGYGKGEINMVVGGPPCQGFSIAGKRNENDRRNELFREFVRVVRGIEPDLFLMENVTGLLSMETPEGESVKEVIIKKFEEAGYEADYKVLNSADYGAPQLRKRVFFLGSRESKNITFPGPAFRPKGGQMRLNGKKKPDYITVGEALSDLPRLKAGERIREYNKPPKNNFQKFMRRKTGKNDLRNHHAVNHRERIVKRFKHIPQGGDMADAPEELRPEKYYSARNRRLKEDKPSYTVTSHVLDELIHPWDNRSVTVREAARLQSFPDHYVFKGERNMFHSSPKTSQYEQVGNAVPVSLARAIATHIIRKYYGKEPDLPKGDFKVV